MTLTMILVPFGVGFLVGVWVGLAQAREDEP